MNCLIGRANLIWKTAVTPLCTGVIVWHPMQLTVTNASKMDGYNSVVKKVELTKSITLVRELLKRSHRNTHLQQQMGSSLFICMCFYMCMCILMCIVFK